MREAELLDELAPFLAHAGPGILVGHGDDAAVLSPGTLATCVTVDVLVEGVHFRRDVSSPADIGWKAIAVNVSDLAAVGARPVAAVVGLCVPEGLSRASVRQLYEGMDEACRRWNVRLVGGDTTRSGDLVVSVTALGEADADRVVPRSGARPGDRLVVVGTLGAAAAALAQLDAGVAATPALLAAHRRPVALPAAGQRLAADGATALIDCSDGLGVDLARLCQASGVSVRVDAAALPVAQGVADAARAAGVDALELACAGGEDFALLAAVPVDAETAAAAAGAAEAVPARVAGAFVEAGERPLVALERDGQRQELAGQGYEHRW